MSVQKKSLISNLSATKKAIVASTPLVRPSEGSATVSPNPVRAGRITKAAKYGKPGRLGSIRFGRS